MPMPDPRLAIVSKVDQPPGKFRHLFGLDGVSRQKISA
ncbi:hypothetical protein D082_25460 [Synechocystis sp. PCC 6714]|nr:hypothetical protein D082_25460 [Synechocystis sp. PCC 6714]